MNATESTFKTKTVYSIRIKYELSKLGFEPIVVHENPYKEKLRCWVYAVTPEFLEAFDKLVNKEG